jgi:hypothetical protein
LAAPSTGATTAACNVASAPAQAGFTPVSNGNGASASIRASGNPATSDAVIVRSLAAMAKYSVSLRLRAARARPSKAARRARAK